MKRVRHELFFIEKNRSLQLEVKVVFPTIRRKDIDHGIFVRFQGGVECDSVE